MSQCTRDWSLDASARAARALLAKAAGCDLDGWHAFRAKYKHAKRRLTDALCPETGRREIAVTSALSPTDKLRSLKAALRECLDVARVRRWVAAQRVTSSDEEHRAAALRAAEKAEKLTGACERAQASLFVLADGLQPCDVDNASAALCGCFPAAKMRPNQKVSRALASYLRNLCALSADESAQVVDLIMTAAQVQPKAGYAVLSANVLDILTMSECCAYSSCHRIGAEDRDDAGCHRAGPLAYCLDGATLIAYYYEAAEDCAGFDLPRKLWRQVVYVDAQRHAAALGKHYGAAPPDGILKAVRRMVAEVLHRLQNHRWKGEPHWVRCKANGVEIDNPSELPYVDALRECVQRKGGRDHRPQITLADSVPCPACGDHDIRRPGRLTCGRCVRPHFTCDGCEEDCEGEGEPGPNGGAYCGDCWSELFDTCSHCGRTGSRDDYRCSDNGDGVYCESCYCDLFAYCHLCDSEYSAEDSRNLPATVRDEDTCCPACYDRHVSACDRCGEDALTDDLSDENVLGASLCPDCQEAQEHAEGLCARLVRSPLYLRYLAEGRGAGAYGWKLLEHLPYATRRHFALLDNLPDYAETLRLVAEDATADVA